MKPYCGITKIKNDNGIVTIDFEIFGGEGDYNLADFDLSSIGKIDWGRGWGDENNFCSGWVVLSEEDIINMPKVGDRFIGEERIVED